MKIKRNEKILIIAALDNYLKVTENILNTASDDDIKNEFTLKSNEIKDLYDKVLDEKVAI
jgi:transcription initiation factor IIE alpha subunit